MIKFIKSLFTKGQTQQAIRGAGIKKLPNYDFLILNDDDKLNKLVEDGYYEVYTTYSSREIHAAEEEETSPNDQDSPTVKEFEFFIPVNDDNRKVEYKVKQEVLNNMFDFFQGSMASLIRLEEFQSKRELDNLLLNVEEKSKRNVAFIFFKDVFQTFKYEQIALNEPRHKFPKGIEPNNFLSKAWLFEDHIKSNLFHVDKELIYRFLYYKKSLELPNIHKSYPFLMELVRFCGRRNFLIKLNEIYEFEQNHPYGEKIAKGLLFENHTDLFKNECTFNWTIEILLNENELANKFCSTLALVLKTEKAFNPSAKYSDFCNFLNQNFNTNFNKLRPDEVDRYKPGQTDFKKLISDLNSFIEKKN